MKGYTMTLRLKQKIAGLAILAAVLPIMGMLINTAFQKAQTSEVVISELDILVRDNLERVALDVYGSCSSSNQVFLKTLENNLQAADYLIDSKGKIRLTSDQVSWTAINQLTKQSQRISLPKVYVGNQWLGQVKSKSRSVPVVDKLEEISGATYTIFQRMNNNGDLLRVATNVIGSDGNRAVGSYIPAHNPDGKQNEVVASVMRGQEYFGRAFVVNKWYLTKYKPLYDNDGRIIGALYVGIPLDEMTELRQSIMDIKLGQTGYVYVIGGKGEQKGRYIISAGGTRDGDDIWESQDENGKYFIQDIVNESVKLNPGQTYYADYIWDGRVKRVALTYFEEWDWVVGSGAYEDEFQATYVKVNSALKALIVSSLIGGLILIAVMAALSLFVGGRIATPILKIRDVALDIAKGNLNTEIDVKSKDEVGELANAFREMSDSLKNKALVAKEIASGNLDVNIDIASKHDELGYSMQEMKDKISGLAGEIQDITTAVQQGNLSKRGDSSAFSGGWADLIDGLNVLIESFVSPLEMITNYVSKLGLGDIPEQISEKYHGDFNKIKDGMNSCIDSIELLITDTKSLVKGALDGDLNFRADVSKHEGDYATIIDGVNKTLDAVIAPIKESSNILNYMAKGDLSNSMVGQYKGDHAIVKDSLNSTLDALNNLLSQTSVAISQVADGANQVSQSSQSLSQGATEQAASVEEVSASVTEIGGQTRQNAENAAEANKLANDSRQSAEKGNHQMDQMLEAMDDINKSSAEIQKIIKVIDEIAFQTNLLALNAAVEAARAGVHGKGFAVVAEEVRNLAHRSAVAAKETTELIEGSATRSEKGASIANETADSLKEIANGITKVTDLISEIDHSSREQSVAVDQVSDALNQIDQVTQSNTASAEESAATAEELSGQSAHLQEMVGRFKLSTSTGLQPSNAFKKAKEPDYTDSFSSETSGEKPKSTGAMKEVNPDDVISLDDDDFGDF